MKIKITRSHYEKYSEMCKTIGLSFANDDKVLGYTREQIRDRAAEDKNLNNIQLKFWDAHAYGLQSSFARCKIPFSLCYGVCCLKHAALFDFAGIEPELVETYQESLK